MDDSSPTPATARITGLHVSDGGVPKLAVAEARVGVGGLTGDRQEHLKYHGGPDRAVCLFSHDVMQRLAAEGHPIGPGTTGENVCVAGLDWAALVPGAQLRFADGVRLEVTGYAQPCRQIAASFRDGAFERILHDRHPGESRIYARVLDVGTLRVGELVRLMPTG